MTVLHLETPWLMYIDVFAWLEKYMDESCGDIALN
jgi:hypothetical protein